MGAEWVHGSSVTRAPGDSVDGDTVLLPSERS